MALGSAFYEISHVEKYRDLEIPAKGQLWSLKELPFDIVGMVSY